jgi:predicted O-methyltransferase YrrM
MMGDMSSGNRYIDQDVYDYLVALSVREDAVLAELRAFSAQLPGATMQISPEQGQLMTLLARLMQARRAIEVGVFTGYSALCIARGLPDDGLLVACEIDEEHMATALRFWERAGVAGKIDFRLAPALDTLDELLAGDLAGAFDLAFIDADKENYPAYYESLLRLVRPNGLMVIDNVLWGGKVMDTDQVDPQTSAIRSLNDQLRDDERVDTSLLPIGDGVMLARKR